MCNPSVFWSLHLQLRRFDVVGLHKGSVTSLAWSTNGMKLFSGDDKGRVVFSSLDLDQVMMLKCDFYFLFYKKCYSVTDDKYVATFCPYM